MSLRVSTKTSSLSTSVSSLFCSSTSSPSSSSSSSCFLTSSNHNNFLRPPNQHHHPSIRRRSSSSSLSSSVNLSTMMPSSSFGNNFNHYFSSNNSFLISSFAQYSEAMSDHHMGDAYTSGTKDSSSSATASNKTEQQRKKPPPEADFNTTCPFKCLGLKRSASKEDVRINYLQLAKVHHPDVGGETKKFRRVQAAYKQSIEMIETGYAAKTAHKTETQSYQAPNERERNGEKSEGCVNEQEAARAKWRRRTAAQNQKNEQRQQQSASASSNRKNKNADAKRTANFSSASTFANAERQQGSTRTSDGTTSHGNSYSNRSAYYNSFMAGGEEAFKTHEFSNFQNVHARDENATPHNSSSTWFKETCATSNFKTSKFNTNTNETYSAAREEKMSKEQQNEKWGFTWSEDHHHQKQNPNPNAQGYANNFTGGPGYASATPRHGDFREERGMKQKKKSGRDQFYSDMMNNNNSNKNGDHHYSSTTTSSSNTNEDYGPKKRSRFDNIRSSPSSSSSASGNNESENTWKRANDEQQASYEEYGNGAYRHEDGAFRVFSTKNRKPSASTKNQQQQNFTNSFDGAGQEAAAKNKAYSSSSEEFCQNQSAASDEANEDGSQNSSSYHSKYEWYRQSQEETEREFGADEGWFEFRENFFKKNRSITTRDLYRFRFSQATTAEEIDHIYTDAMNHNVFDGWDYGEPLHLAIERYHLGLGLGNKHLEKCLATIADWEKRTNRTAAALYYHVILKLYTNPDIMWLFPDLDSSTATEVVWKVLQVMQDKEVVDDACVGRSWWELLRLSCMKRGNYDHHHHQQHPNHNNQHHPGGGHGGNVF